MAVSTGIKNPKIMLDQARLELKRRWRKSISRPAQIAYGLLRIRNHQRFTLTVRGNTFARHREKSPFPSLQGLLFLHD